MANKFRGEAEIVSKDGERKQLVRINTAVICRLEATMQKPLGRILEDLGSRSFSVTTLRTVLMFAAVCPKPLTVDQASEMLDAFTLEQVNAGIDQAMKGALGHEEPPDEKTEEGAANPPQAPSTVDAS